VHGLTICSGGPDSQRDREIAGRELFPESDQLIRARFGMDPLAAPKTASVRRGSAGLSVRGLRAVDSNSQDVGGGNVPF
jgi:hypothetical protein